MVVRRKQHGCTRALLRLPAIWRHASLELRAVVSHVQTKPYARDVPLLSILLSILPPFLVSPDGQARRLPAPNRVPASTSPRLNPGTVQHKNRSKINPQESIVASGSLFPTRWICLDRPCSARSSAHSPLAAPRRWSVCVAGSFAWPAAVLRQVRLRATLANVHVASFVRTQHDGVRRPRALAPAQTYLR